MDLISGRFITGWFTPKIRPPNEFCLIYLKIEAFLATVEYPVATRDHNACDEGFMTDFATLGWTAGVVIWLAIALYVWWITWRVGKDRLMRCPETGSIALVGVESDTRASGKAPGVKVQRCVLWPKKWAASKNASRATQRRLPITGSTSMH